jgi:hypothetical protein
MSPLGSSTLRWSRRGFIESFGCCMCTSIACAGEVTVKQATGSVTPGVVADLALADVGGFEFTLEPPVNLLPGGAAFWHHTFNACAALQSLFKLDTPDYYKWLVDDSNYSSGLFCAASGCVVSKDLARPIPHHSGVILIGVNVTKLLCEVDSPIQTENRSVRAGLNAALAHETAHIYQFRRLVDGQPLWNKLLTCDNNTTRRRPELHADFLSGWCLGNLGSLSQEDLAVDLAAQKLYSLGSFTPGDPNDHGTSEQRYVCFLRGFFAAKDMKLSVDQASDYGELFLNAVLPKLSEP